MFSHWSRPQLGLAPHAVREVVHRKQNLATRGCVIASDCVDNSGCPYWPLSSIKTFGLSAENCRYHHSLSLHMSNTRGISHLNHPGLRLGISLFTTVRRSCLDGRMDWRKLGMKFCQTTPMGSSQRKWFHGNMQASFSVLAGSLFKMKTLPMAQW